MLQNIFLAFLVNTIVIRNGKTVWKVVWIESYLRLNLSSRRYPRLSQHTSNVNIECAGKLEWSKQMYSLCVTSLLEHWNTLILLFWYCLTTPVISLYHRRLILEENIAAVVTQDRVTDGNLKRQIKNQTLCTCRLFRLD